MSESQIIERNEDMSPIGRLALILQPDGDVIVAVRPDPEEFHQTSVEFCQPFSGGGRSPETLRALKALAEAMKKDNAENPIFTDSRRQLPPFDPNRYRSVEEMQAEIDRLRTINAKLVAACEQVLRWHCHDWSSGGIPADVTKDPSKLLQATLAEVRESPPSGTTTVRWRKGGAQGEPWDPSLEGRHVMIPAKDFYGKFDLHSWFASPVGWENITWWIPAEDLKPPEIPPTP